MGVTALVARLLVLDLIYLLSVQVIPPKEWTPRRNGYSDVDLVIPCPVTQEVHGREGVYEIYAVEPRNKKGLTVKEFEKKANSAE